MSKRFTTAAEPSAAIKWADLHGDLLLIEPTGIEKVTTRFGESDAVAAAVHVIAGDNAGVSHPEGKVFPTVLRMQLQQSIGGIVVGRLIQGTANGNQSAPWMLATEVSDEDAAIAEKWLDQRDASSDDSTPDKSAGDRPNGEDLPF